MACGILLGAFQIFALLRPSWSVGTPTMAIALVGGQTDHGYLPGWCPHQPAKI